MPEVAYDVSIGSQRASSSKRDNDRQLMNLTTELDMDGVGGRCVVELAGAAETQPELADSVSIKLNVGEGEQTVFTGRVEGMDATATGQRITAFDGIARLARLDVEQAYENVTLDYIVKDLMQQAQVDAGTLIKGPKVPNCVLFRGPRALGHIRRLAALYGVDLYTDGDGKVHLTGPETDGAEHVFTYGEDVLALNLERVPPAHDGVEVWGEGAASSMGAEKYYWLPTDLASVSAKAAVSSDGSVSEGSAGTNPRRVVAGLLRSGEAVQSCAEGKMTALAARLTRGNIEVFGAPAVQPGDRVKLAKLPPDHATADAAHSGLRVRRVHHHLSVQRGFITRLGF